VEGVRILFYASPSLSSCCDLPVSVDLSLPACLPSLTPHGTSLTTISPLTNQPTNQPTNQLINRHCLNYRYFYTPDGKPDKKRRPGRPWDPSIFAGEERQTYHGGKNDILGEMPDKNKTKPGSEESIQQTLNQMSLQTYLQEVNAYQELLNPIQGILQNTLGGPMGKPNPEDLGWGKEGRELAPAMWKIGATPSSWHRPLSPGGTTALSAAEILALEEKKAIQEEEARVRAEEAELERQHKAAVAAKAKKGWRALKGAYSVILCLCLSLSYPSIAAFLYALTRHDV
jgi:hypothetical protein